MAAVLPRSSLQLSLLVLLDCCLTKYSWHCKKDSAMHRDNGTSIKLIGMNKKNISTAFLVAIIVGTLLNLINSYDVLFEEKFTGKNAIKIMLTYDAFLCLTIFFHQSH